MVRLPSSDELGSALTSVLQQTFRWSGPVSILERRDNIYAGSSPSEIVTCELRPGCSVRVLCKYGELVVGRQNHRAGTAGEEIVYRQVLEPLAIGKPAFFGSYSDPTSGETWLFFEYLERGERLNKVGEPGTGMPATAQWLGGFHAQAEKRLRDGFNPRIRRYDHDYYQNWARQTLLFAEPMRERYPWLQRACFQFEDATEALERAPATVVHGEFYPHNILLVDGVVIPVDWESAMIGAGEIDLAALVEKWAPDVVEVCKAAYATARWPAGAPGSFIPALEAARLYWQLRWLGDRPEWTLDKSLEPRFEELRRLANQWSTRS